jgi:hypothetical protein
MYTRRHTQKNNKFKKTSTKKDPFLLDKLMMHEIQLWLNNKITYKEMKTRVDEQTKKQEQIA